MGMTIKLYSICLANEMDKFWTAVIKPQVPPGLLS